jgi:hypothetical protein
MRDFHAYRGSLRSYNFGPELHDSVATLKRVCDEAALFLEGFAGIANTRRNYEMKTGPAFAKLRSGKGEKRERRNAMDD